MIADVCMQLSTLNFGIFLVYWIGYGFSSHTSSYAWRVPCILQLAMLTPMLVLCWLIDETPRWLVAHDRHDEALDVLKRLRGQTMAIEDIQALHDDIVKTAQMEKAIGSGSWGDLLKNDSIQSLRRLLTACGIQAMQQLGGKSILNYLREFADQRNRHQCYYLLFVDIIPEKLGLRWTYVRPYGRWSTDLVLPCLFHSMVSH